MSRGLGLGAGAQLGALLIRIAQPFFCHVGGWRLRVAPLRLLRRVFLRASLIGLSRDWSMFGRVWS